MKLKFKCIFIKYTAHRFAVRKYLYRPFIVYGVISLDQKYMLYELDEYGGFTKKL